MGGRKSKRFLPVNQLNQRKLYIRTPKKFIPGTETTPDIQDATEGTFLDYNLRGVLTIDHFTKDPYEAIIGAPDIKDAPRTLSAVNIQNLLDNNTGDIKFLSVTGEQITIPDSLNLKFIFG